LAKELKKDNKSDDECEIEIHHDAKNRNLRRAIPQTAQPRTRILHLNRQNRKIQKLALPQNLMATRAERYEAKLSGANRAKLYEDQKRAMAAKEKAANDDFVKIELEVKRICNGVPMVHLPYYIIFAKEIYRLKRRCTAQTLLNEVIIREQKWEARGLNVNRLDDIKELYLQMYERHHVFRCDISLLDGPDRLG